MKKARMSPRNGLVAGLDIGTSKVCCFIARADEEGRPHVTGIGHQLSRGVRNGSIVDLEAAETAILTAVPRSEEHTAELQSRENLVSRLLPEQQNGPPH